MKREKCTAKTIIKKCYQQRGNAYHIKQFQITLNVIRNNAVVVYSQTRAQQLPQYLCLLMHIVYLTIN